MSSRAKRGGDLPASWTEAPARCAAAGVPDDVAFATRPTLLGDMVERAVAAGVPGRWVAGDEVFPREREVPPGGDPKLTRRLEGLGLGYGLAIAVNRKLPITATTSRTASRITTHPGSLPRRGVDGGGCRGRNGGPVDSAHWQQVVERAERDAEQSGRRWWRLIRRHPRTGEQAYYLCCAPTVVPLGDLVRVAGRRGRSRSPSRPPRA